MSSPNKGPSLVRTENLPPWRWKIEKAPKHHNPGPGLQVSVNNTQPGPLLEDGEEAISAPVECIESRKNTLLEPSSMSQPVIPLKVSPVLEDGKDTQAIDSHCVESSHQELIPHREGQSVLPTTQSTILENTKLNKSLV
jgi:hypothetical protein